MNNKKLCGYHYERGSITVKRTLLAFLITLFAMLCGCGQRTQASADWIPKNSDVDLHTLTASYVETTQNEDKDEEESNYVEACCVIPNKVLVIGNSITLGFGTHGMASSSIETDYYHILENYLIEKNSNLVMNRIDGRPWENSVSSDDRMIVIDEKIKPLLDNETDLVIIQLGDNINTAEKRATYQEDSVALVQEIRNVCPGARILWVFGWYGADNVSTFESICERTDIEYVNIYEIASNPDNKSYVGAEYVDSNGVKAIISEGGVASHPGDKGMQLIAEKII